LFSAVVTTFVVQSYPGLQPDPTQTSTEILTRISMQLSSLTVNQGFINSTIPAANLQKVEQFTPSTSSVVVNLLWFTSLVFSLVSALCGIFTRQWLRQYAGWEVSSARQSVRLRQFRYNGLQRWGVPHIMTFLPILLQLSLVLFFAGLIEILWSLHRTIA
ncbi:hypothetical protein PUNSTDRAFT_31307, partial [Punctularia strigosozonata HHB-11173 SS5]|uniref:uncharacterized protein n=1 Tax=Punctularia strigosozonata (strain HHB-11173) TaxID=741275 RepID=UPI00044172E7